jgi:hypothetical protein
MKARKKNPLFVFVTVPAFAGRIIFDANISKIQIEVSSADNYDDLNSRNKCGSDVYYSNFNGIVIDLGTQTKVQAIPVGGVLSGGDQLLITDGKRFKHLNASQAFWYRLFKSVFKDGGDALTVILNSDDSKAGMLLDDTLVGKKFRTYIKAEPSFSAQVTATSSKGKVLIGDDFYFYSREGDTLVIDGLVKLGDRQVAPGDSFKDAILFPAE